MKYIIGFVMLLAIVLGLYSLVGNAPTAEAPNDVATTTNDINNNASTSSTESVKKEETMQEDNTITKAIFKTNQGDVTVELFADKAPNTVANFVKLAQEGFYDGVKFHRVIKGFMIQGGDPLSKDDSMKDSWGMGGPGYKFADELPQAGEYKIGSLAMANSGPNTNGSQFFIVTGANGENLPPLYSLFGQVVSGMDAVSAIENIGTDANDRPVEAQIIESIVLE